jgi:hypothetical protein
VHQSQSWRKGENKRLISKNGRPIIFKLKHKWGGWKRCYANFKSEAAFVRKLTAVAIKLKKRKMQLSSLIDSGHEIFLVSFIQKTSAITISPELNSLLGALGMNLQLDFWT